MSGESTQSTLTGWLNTSLLSALVAPYAIDPNPMSQHVRTEMLPAGTGTGRFSRITKDTALSGTITEATGLSNTAFDVSKATATTAEVGIMRQLTKKSEKQNMLGPGGLMNEVLLDGTFMNFEKMETDCWAEAANASTSVGTSGQTFKAVDVASAIAQHTVNKSGGLSLVGFLHATAAKNLRNELVTSGATWLATGAANRLMENVGPDGFIGHFMVDLYTNNLAVTATADKTSIFHVDAAVGSQKLRCATGLAVSWLPEVASWSNPTFSGGMQVAITSCYGLAEVIDYAYVKANTIA